MGFLLAIALSCMLSSYLNQSNAYEKKKEEKHTIQAICHSIKSSNNSEQFERDCLMLYLDRLVFISACTK